MKRKNKTYFPLALCVLGLCTAGLCAVLTACGNTASSATPTATPAPTATPLPDDILNQPVTMPEAGSEVDSGMGVTPDATPAEPDSELSGILDKMYEIYPIPFMLDTRAVDLNDESWLRYYTGLDSAEGLEAAVASEAMIGSQAYSVVLVRVADGTDAGKISQSMAEGIDPRKWICVEADQVWYGSGANYAILAMVDSSLEVDAGKICDAFFTAANPDNYDGFYAQVFDGESAAK